MLGLYKLNEGQLINPDPLCICIRIYGFKMCKAQIFDLKTVKNKGMVKKASALHGYI